jgi:hypothetical protein
VKYWVFEELRSAGVPIPYLLFSQTKTAGRFQSLAFEIISHFARFVEKASKYHIESFKDLTLVASTITVESKSTVFLAEVLLSKGNTGTNGYLRTDDTITSEERRGKDVHGTTFAMRHATLTSKEFTKDTRNRTTTHHSERVTPVSGDDPVIFFDTMFKTNRHRFLRARFNAQSTTDKEETYLTNGQMTKPANELRFIESICSHFHTTHGLHLAIHTEELVAGYLNLKVGLVALVGMKRILMNFDRQRL